MPPLVVAQDLATLSQPHQLDIALRLAFKPAARVDAVEVAVDVDLQQYRWMIGGASRGKRFDSFETQLQQRQLINEGVDDSNWIVFGDEIFEAFWENGGLITIQAFNKSLHEISRPNEVVSISAPSFSHSLGHELPFTLLFFRLSETDGLKLAKRPICIFVDHLE